MGVPMRRVDCNYMTLHYCTHLGGLLKLGTNYRQCRHAGEANSMQYLVLLPGLALADRSKLFIQSRAHVTCKDGARAERYPKRYPNDTKIFPKAPRVTDWSQNRKQAEQVVDVGSML